MSRIHALVLVGLSLSLLASAPAAAKKKPPAAKKKVVALFPIINKDGADAATVEAVGALLDKASALIEQVDVVSGAKLKKATKVDPAKAMDACGANLGCIAGLGKKAKAEEVLLGRAAVKDGAVTILFLAVGVKSKGLERKVPLTFANADSVKSVLGASFYDLFGITTPGSLTITGAAGQVRIDGEYKGNGPGPYEVKPGRHEVATGGVSTTVTLLPGASKTISINDMTEAPATVASAAAGSETTPPPAAPAPPAAPSEAKPPPAPAGGGEWSAPPPEEGALALVDPKSGGTMVGTELGVPMAPTPTATASEPAPVETAMFPTTPPGPKTPEPSHALRWVGIVAGVVGLGVLGTGFYFGSKADATAGSKNGLSQLAVEKRNKDAQSAAKTSNIFLIGGGAVAAVGATLLVLDLASGPAEPHTSLSVESAGAGANISLRW